MGNKGSNTSHANDKTLAKKAIAGATTEHDREEQVLKAFRDWDGNGDGTIEKEELKSLMTKLDKTLSDKDIDAMFAAADADHSGSISYEEMINWLFCSPALEKYFKMWMALSVERQDAIEKNRKEYDQHKEQINSCQETKNKFADKTEALFKHLADHTDAKLRPMIEDTFRFHDKDSNETLTVDESIIFFSNYVRLLRPYMGQLAQQYAEHHYSDHEKALAYWASAGAGYEKKLEDQEAAYHAKQDDKNRDAFGVIDKNGDGKLQKNEFVDALLPGTQKNLELMKKLGISARQPTMVENPAPAAAPAE